MEDLNKLLEGNDKKEWWRALETSNFPNENLLQEEEEIISNCGPMSGGSCSPSWAVGEWSGCDPSECFNWNTGKIPKTLNSDNDHAKVVEFLLEREGDFSLSQKC